MRLFQLKVTLRGTRPPVWRRILVSPEITLDQLHHVLQIAMGWTNSHLHQFETPQGFVADPGFGLDQGGFGMEKMGNSKRTTLASVLSRPRSSIRYEYDMGDGWDHQITLEKVVVADQPSGAVCVAGKRACPPEDCGGPWGYDHLLEAVRDPQHPEHEEMSDWIEPGFDPERFDPEAINKQLARLSARWKKKASVK